MIRLAAFMILLALPAAAQDNPIVARMTALAAAFNAGDANAVALFYSKDAAILAPGQTRIINDAGIYFHFKQALQLGAGNMRFNILEIRQHGPETAIAIGEVLTEVDGKDIGTRYMHVWQLEEGEWRIHRDLYHVAKRPN